MLGFLRDPIWQFVGAVIALVTLVFMILIELRREGQPLKQLFSWSAFLFWSCLILIISVVIDIILEVISIRLPPPPPPQPPSCQAKLADDIFKQVLARDHQLAHTIGNHVMPEPTCIFSTYQPFEGGEMIWRSDMLYPTDVNVLFTSGNLRHFRSGYRSGSPLQSCDTQPSQENRLQPIGGFGRVWCDNQDIRRQLGYAIIEERPIARPLQTFENGWLILINHTVYALFDRLGEWKSISAFDYKYISLKLQSDFSESEVNLGLRQGIRHLPDLPNRSSSILDPVSGKSLSVPFDVGWKVSTQCRGPLVDRPDYIQIDANISRPLGVYLLLQAGWGLNNYDGERIGKVSLEFDDGGTFDTPLILGGNIRDWADRPGQAVTKVSSVYSQLAWEGKDPNRIPGRMDILINDIPDNYWPLTLKRIQIWDESRNRVGRMDPCIHLLAVTVKYLP